MKGTLKFLTALTFLTASTQAESDTLPVPKQRWDFEGISGTYDRAALQRGYQVYKEVCSACHGVKQLTYQDLMKIGLSKEAVKVLAAEHDFHDINDEGQAVMRKGIPSDKIHFPFPNDKAARAANNGALPPDLSLITKARAGGPNYLYAILTGYCEAPASTKVSEGMHYNPYFSGRQIAMPPPLSDGQVTYADGTKATVVQMSKDVVAFLSWAAEPEMEHRKQMGVKVLFYLFVLTFVLYLSKRKIWKKIK